MPASGISTQGCSEHCGGVKPAFCGQGPFAGGKTIWFCRAETSPSCDPITAALAIETPMAKTTAMRPLRMAVILTPDMM